MLRTESTSLEAANWKKRSGAMFLMKCYWPAMSLGIILTCSVATHALTPDGEALLVFKAALQDPIGILENWRLTDTDPCHWTGVTCSAKKRVINLNLPFSRLWGSISPALGKLQQLRRLSLHENSLFGDFPVELANCSKLRALYLQANFLSGHIPVELGSLSKLVILDISSNALSGTIPSSLGNLKKLEYLNISTNFLAGQIPQTGVLANFSSSSFAGNLDLCGQQVSRICKKDLSSPSVIEDLNATNSKSFNTVTTKAPPGYINTLLISAMSTMGISFALVVMCFWGYVFYSKFGNRENFSKQVTSPGSSQKIYIFHGDLPYTSREIMKKIEALDETDMIGSGGFGMVYKLNMGSSNIFAVKKIEKNRKSHERIFERELEILGMLKHRNLVNLRGYCNAHSVNFLIYDYLPNGSLDNFLHARKPEVPPLSWAARLKIAIGAARGLAYLHHDCCPRIVHRDIKSSNILLDDNFDPHVADFGLAKLLEENESHATTVFAGTFGYLAPEYMQSGRATEKTDVYSFGVLLLELISGKRPNDVSFVEMGVNIVGWVDKLMKERRHNDILDPILDPNCEEGTNESLDSMLQIASLCVSAAPEERPCMSNVVKMLEAEIMSPCPSEFYDSSSD